MEGFPHVLVVKDYSCQNENELTLKRGDVIQIIETGKKDLWKGICEKKEGLFPSSCVIPLEMGKALYDLPPKSEEILPLKKGSLFKILDSQDDNWWIAIDESGKEGLVPALFVKLTDERCWEARAMYHFKAKNTTIPQLSFRKGDDIVVVKKESNWWSGHLKGNPDFIGQFPSNFVQIADISERSPSIIILPAEAAELEEDKTEKYRNMVLEEIVSTEKFYAQDLDVLLECYYVPLVEQQIISKQSCEGLFSNLHELAGISHHIVTSFEKNKEGGYAVAKVLYEAAEEFKVYTVYCVNHPNALKVLEKCRQNSSFVALEKKSEGNPKTKSLGLAAYLIKPIQRICKYPILLKELIKYTSEEHPDFESLAIALDKIEQVVSYINENKRLNENKEKLESIQEQITQMPNFDFVTATRSLVMELKVHGIGRVSALIEAGDKGTIESSTYQLFLFNDLLLVTKKKKEKFKYVKRIYMDKLRVIDVVQQKDKVFSLEICDRYDDSKIPVYVKEESLKQHFIKEVKRVTKEYFLEHQEQLEAEAQRYFQKFEFTESQNPLNKKKLGKIFGTELTDQEMRPTSTKITSGGGKSKLEKFFGSQLSHADLNDKNKELGSSHEINKTPLNIPKKTKAQKFFGTDTTPWSKKKSTRESKEVNAKPLKFG